MDLYLSVCLGCVCIAAVEHNEMGDFFFFGSLSFLLFFLSSVYVLNNININALAVSRSKGFYPVWREEEHHQVTTPQALPPDLLVKARACGAAQRTGPYR